MSTPRSSATIEKPRLDGPGSGLGGNWRVIVLNDDHNTFEGVARALAAVVPGVTPAAVPADGLSEQSR